MFLADNTGARRRVGAAIAAAIIFTPLALAVAMPAWAQVRPAPFAAQVSPKLHGYLLDDGEFTVIDASDAILGTGALGINNRGQIVSSYADTNRTIHGFLLDNGVFTTIDHPDAAVPGRAPGFRSGAALGTGAIGINNRGQIVGQYGAADGRIHGFLLDDGEFTTIDAPGAINTNASDINDRGEIVGFFLDANNGH